MKVHEKLLNPVEPHLTLNAGELLQLSQQFERSNKENEAINLLRNWLSNYPNGLHSYAVWYEYGRMLQNSKNYVTAQHAFQAALEQKPFFIEATLALGKSLESQGKKNEAINTWQSAIVENRLQIDLLNNIARVQDDTNDLVKIEKTLLKSLELDPDQDSVLTTLLQVRQKLCRWPVISKEIPVSVEKQKKNIGPLMSLALDDNPEKNYEASLSFLKSKNLYVKTNKKIKINNPKNKKIKVGFLSADFRLHATSVFFSPLIKLFDKNNFEISLLDITTTQDAFPEFRNSLISSANNYVPLQELNDSSAIQRCRSLKLDVVVDLGGLTSGARPRLIAERIAPVQISYIGFLASTAMPNLDYVITVPDMLPQGRKGFSEKFLCLESPYLPIDASVDIATELTRESLNIDKDTFLFCALLNTYKIRKEVFGAWMKILKNVPNSVIWLIEDNKVARENLEMQAKKYGVDSGRLIFSPRVHPAIYRNQLALCDLFLDAFPYGSGATARDVIHANLPMLTKPGNTMMSKLSSHLIKNLGLSELVCESSDEYIRKASLIGKNLKSAQDLKEKIKTNKNNSELFNVKKFVDEFYKKIVSVI